MTLICETKNINFAGVSFWFGHLSILHDLLFAYFNESYSDILPEIWISFDLNQPKILITIKPHYSNFVKTVTISWIRNFLLCFKSRSYPSVFGNWILLLENEVVMIFNQNQNGVMRKVHLEALLEVFFILLKQNETLKRILEKIQFNLQIRIYN